MSVKFRVGSRPRCKGCPLVCAVFCPSTGLTFRSSFRSIESQKVFHLLKSSVNLCQSFSLALDAHCLLEVYDVLKKLTLESRLRVNMEPALVLSWLQPKKEKQRY